MNYALNIPKSIMMFARPVQLDIDLNTLGVRQQSSLRKMLKTGICKGNGIPSRLASAIRQQCGAPVYREGSYSRAKWHNANPELDTALFDALTASVLHAKVADKNWGAYRYNRQHDYCQDAENAVKERKREFTGFWVVGKAYRKNIYKAQLRTTEKLDETIRLIESGELDVIRVDAQLINA